MTVLKSLTHRTVVEVTVTEKGEVICKATRDGQVYHSFEIPPEYGPHIVLTKTKDGIEISEEGAMGSMRVVDTIKV